MKIFKTIILMVGLCATSTLLFAAPPKNMTIIVKEAKAYATPSYFGKVVATLAYTEKVSIIEEKGSWYKISLAGGKQGWINSSALSKQSLTAKGSSQDIKTGASSEEVELAGKGFNEEVEAKYKKDNKLDYSWIDRMETYKVALEDMTLFLANGGLDTTGGAQ